MRYIKQHMASIADIEIFPIISLIIFLGFFVALAIYAFTANKDRIQRIKNIPLKENEDSELYDAP